MITEDYVSFETAKLLKEKGFNEPVLKFYDHKGEVAELYYRSQNKSITGDTYKCPTLQMAIKWLREKHKVTIGILFEEDRIYYEIHQNNEFVVGIYTPKSYEKVCDEAIKYCLKILI